jgi:hypothetical protein
MAAENRNVSAFVVRYNGMPGFVYGIQKIQIVNRPFAAFGVTVGLHAGDAAVLAAVAFILIDNDTFHSALLKSSRPRAFPG